MHVIVDTDALLALVNTQDALHIRARRVVESLYRENASILLLPTTLSEFSLLATSWIGMRHTKLVIETWLNSAGHTLLEIDKKHIQGAIKRYLLQTSKEESLFDCYVMEAAERYHTDGIFSFDKGYKKKMNGFVLAEELLT